jgi:NADP-dependent 3-hydroxy acid dehydrogenase YdfG
MNQPNSCKEHSPPLKALVTGASSGIGQAIAKRLTAQGIHTALVSRSAQDLPTYGKAYPVDLSAVRDVKSKIQWIVQDMNGIDILINCAGMAYIGELIAMSLEDWQKLFDLNVTSVFQCIQGVLPTMRSQGSGTILNVASIAGKQGFAHWSAYCATKFALLGMTQALAEEERSHGIRVMAICPGSVDTPLWDSLGDRVPSNFDRQAMLQPETVADAVMHMINLPASAVITELVIMPHRGLF